jgi:phosphonate transport system substrate-binding protein
MRAALVIAAVVVSGTALPAAAQQPGQPAARAGEPARFAVVSFYNPRLMYLKYQPLVDYLSEQTGRRWELVVSPAYESAVEELCGGQVGAAYLGPFTYVRAHARCGAEPVVRLQTGGNATYRSYVMVRSESAMTSLADLRGKRIGFGAPLSTSSHLVPRAMLSRAGLVLGRDLTCVYLAHHERAARAVLLGDVDACAVRDIVGDKFVQRGLKVLARSEPIANFPFVLPPGSSPADRDGLLRALVTLPRSDPAIARRMSGWDEELAAGFAPAADTEYEPIRSIAVETFGPAAFTSTERELTCAGEAP